MRFGGTAPMTTGIPIATNTMHGSKSSTKPLVDMTASSRMRSVPATRPFGTRHVQILRGKLLGIKSSHQKVRKVESGRNLLLVRPRGWRTGGLATAVVEAGAAAEEKHEMDGQLDGDEGEAGEIPRGPMGGARVG